LKFGTTSSWPRVRVVRVRAVEVRIGCDKFWMLYHHRFWFWFFGKITSIRPRARRDSQESRSSFRYVDVGILGLTWQTKTRRLAKDAFRSRRDSQESRRKSRAIRSISGRAEQPSGSTQEASAQRLARDASSRDQEGGEGVARSDNGDPLAYIRARQNWHPEPTLSSSGCGWLGWQAAGGYGGTVAFYKFRTKQPHLNSVVGLLIRPEYV
jgi:hypothetical protein